MKLHRNQSGFSPVEIIIVIVMVGLTGAIGWLVYDRQKKSEQSAQISTAINSFEDCVAAGNPVMESYPEQCSANGKSFTKQLEQKDETSSAVVVFVPDGLYSNEEKNTLKARLTDPFVDHAEQYKGKEGYNPVISVSVNKLSNEEYASTNSGGYRYTVRAVLKNGGTHDFLYGQNDIIIWWLPECYDTQCGLTDGFKTKYPEIVAELKNHGMKP